MSTPGVVVLVASILLLTALSNAGLILWLRRRGARSRADLYADLTFDPAICGPERGTYQGSTGGYPKVAGTGLIALTERSLLFRKITGRRVDLPLTDVYGVRLSKTFNRTRVGGQTCLVVQGRLGEVGYLVSDPDAWAAAITRAAPGLAGRGA